MSKFKVLVLNSDNDGVGYFRLLSPYSCFNDPDIQVDIRLFMDSTLPLFDENFIKQYKIIVFNKPIPFNNTEVENIFNNIIIKYNIKKVYDIDDYWILNSGHPNYKLWKQNNSQFTIENQLRNADAITTTTELLADKIREFNTNVVVTPNSINLKEQQWISNKKPSDKVRFLWGGGITHLIDLRLLKTSFEKLTKSFIQNAQVYLCGFDLRMNTPQGIVKDNINRSPWTFFESIFTNNFRWINNGEYNSWLRKGDDNGRDNYGVNEKYTSEFYQRRWTKPIMLFGTMYNEADVVLTPLKNHNSFNMVKSQLKVIEAGAHHCPIVCSNYGPYTIDDIEGKLDGKQKGFLIDEDKDSELRWKEVMEYYVENPDKIKEHGENLYEYVRDNYEISITNQKRADLFKKLANS